MFESLFVAAVLGAGGPPAPPPVITAPQSPEEARPRFYPLKDASAQLAASAVSVDLRGTGLTARLSFDVQSNSVLVQGSAAVHARVAEFLPQFEEESRSELRVIRLRHVTANDAARVAGERLAASGAAVHLAPAVGVNGVLVFGSPTTQARAAGIVAAIDQEPTPVTAPAPRAVPVVTAAYHLRNAAVGDVCDSIHQELTRSGREAQVRAASTVNQLVVDGSPAVHARVAELVGELDRAVPQVHVQALVAEVPAAFLAHAGLTTPGAPAGGGCYSLNARERDLFALAFRGYPGQQVLSRPQILVRDNQTGHVRVGQDFPVSTSAAPGNTEVEYRFVGVTAEVTPRVMPDGKVLLRVGVQTCDPAAQPAVVRAGVSAFSFNVSTMQTTVLAPAGDTVVIAHRKTGADGKPVAVLLVLTPTVVRP